MEQSDVIISNREQLSPDIVRLTLHAPRIAAHSKPGQFVTIKVSQGLDPLLRRPFSIHQVYPDGSLQVVFKVLGKGTAALAALQPGQSVNIVGPLGTPFKIAPHMCLLGGGLGIAPLLFLAQAIMAQGGTTLGPDLHVILAARHQAELSCFTPDFIELGVTLHLATDDGSLGHHGLITDLIPTVIDDTVAWQVACCGPYPMMRAVAAICRERGLPCQVSLETMMACGISACLGCAVEASASGQGKKYLHVCQDGPVFWEGDIKWTA
jgi:dihydroorotate dehydrogenase electron transfer subunit